MRTRKLWNCPCTHGKPETCRNHRGLSSPHLVLDTFTSLPMLSEGAHAAEIICGTVQDFCRCILPAHSEIDFHECECGGMWKWQDDEFIVKSFPNPTQGYLESLFGFDF